mgnify:CR=1 FL=1
MSYIKHLKAEELNLACRQQTVLYIVTDEVTERAAEIFRTLDERFGAIIHLGADPELARNCFECYGKR